MIGELEPDSAVNSSQENSLGSGPELPATLMGNALMTNTTSSTSSGLNPASSSIPGEIAIAKKFIETSKSIGKVVGSLGLVGFLALIYMTWDLISNANQNIATARDEITNFSKDQTELNKRFNLLEAQIKSLVESSKKTSKRLVTENLDLDSQIKSHENDL